MGQSSGRAQVLASCLKTNRTFLFIHAWLLGPVSQIGHEHPLQHVVPDSTLRAIKTLRVA